MKPTTSFTELIVWQKAHELVLKTYSLTAKFPETERYGLISQMRRAAVSIPANIAEGYAKRSVGEKKRFYNISQGSLQEYKYYVILSRDLKFSEDVTIPNQLEEVSRLLNSYIRGIR